MVGKGLTPVAAYLAQDDIIRVSSPPLLSRAIRGQITQPVVQIALEHDVDMSECSFAAIVLFSC